MTNAEGDDTSGSDTTCDAVLCAANQRVQSNACITCPPGMSNAAGDDASGSNTTCDTIFCAANQQVQNNTCIACPSGATNVAGDRDWTRHILRRRLQSRFRCFVCRLQQAYIKSSNTGAGDNFGYSVALSGDTLAISAHFEARNATGINGNQTDNSTFDGGAVYVFIRSTNLDPQAYIKASNTGASDLFGASVAL